MKRPRLLDLFCGAGGAAMGYHRAGFEVVGVDRHAQPRYPFEFHQADAFKWMASHWREFDVIHASPPCQRYCRMYRGLLQSQERAKDHPDLIAETRQALQGTGWPWVIENVEGSPLHCPVRLCGSSFGLLVQRHRLFEASFLLFAPDCIHSRYAADKPPLHRLYGHSRVVGCYGHGRGKGDTVGLWSAAMGIDWMTRAELSQAIPPAYTLFIGKQLMNLCHGEKEHDAKGAKPDGA